MDLIFGVLTLVFGVYALIKGRLRLSKKYVLEGNSAKYAGFLLVIAPIIGGILTLNGQIDSALFGCSCYSIIGVLAFAVFQMWNSRGSAQVKTQMKNEPAISEKREPAQSHVTQIQPTTSSESHKQRLPDANVNTQTDQKELHPKDLIDPQSTSICPKCGNIGLPNDKFCRKCGNAIKSEIRCEKCGNIVQPKDLFCVKCGSRLSRKNEHEATFECLVAELIEIGKNTKSFNEGDTYYYRRKGEGIGLGEDWDARTREIGDELYRMGANKIQLMQEAHNSVVKVLGSIAGRCLGAHWHEIGKEQWKQGKGECWLF